MNRPEILLLIALVILGVVHIGFIFTFTKGSGEINHYEISYSKNDPRIGKIRIVPLAGHQIRAQLKN